MKFSSDADSLRYPIGQYDLSAETDARQVQHNVVSIAALPLKLAELVQNWTNEQLDTPYRPGGWTVRQLVHHIADSHINAYQRTKLALTETNPTIKPYNEAAWAELPDSILPIEPSLHLLSALHQRWVTILHGLSADDLQRTYYHPGMQQSFTLATMIGLYSWHGEHHFQHACKLAERNGWL
jgi:hypothetical protein